MSTPESAKKSDDYPYTDAEKVLALEASMVRVERENASLRREQKRLAEGWTWQQQYSSRLSDELTRLKAQEVAASPSINLKQTDSELSGSPATESRSSCPATPKTKEDK